MGRAWIASSIAAGVKNDAGTGGTADDNIHFGDANDDPIAASPIVSRIGSIAIGGAVSGTATAGDHFGFAARQIGFFKTAGYSAPLTGATNPLVELSHATGDVTLRELGAGPAVPIAPGPDPVITPLLATWTDVDGDRVALKVSTGDLTTATFAFLAIGPGEQLHSLDLSGGGFDGANITVSVARAATGDGLVNIGYLKSTNHDLGAVVIPGDLGRIDAGDAGATTPALKTIAVRSMGIHGVATQAAGGSLNSNLFGPVGPFGVATEMRETLIAVQGVASTEDGRLASLTIGGSLGGGRDFGGSFRTAGDIGPVKIGGDLFGGLASDSGQILSIDGSIRSITIGRSVHGFGADTGLLSSADEMGAVKIGGNVRGGDGGSSGVISSQRQTATIFVGGSLIAGVGPGSGRISSTSDITGGVSIGHDIAGGGNAFSGGIASSGKMGAVTIGNSVFGGTGGGSASVFSNGDLPSISVRGSVFGGSGIESGKLDTNGALGAVSIRGSLVGGSNTDSGQIESGGSLGRVSIGHDVIGGDGTRSARISAGARLVALGIGGSLFGGEGASSGVVVSTGDAGAITLGGNVVGGKLASSARLDSAAKLGLVKIAGSLLGGAGASSGVIQSTGSLGPVQIGGDVRGGGASDSGEIFSASGRIAALSVGGSLLGGAGDTSGLVQGNAGIGAMTIGRNLIGGAGTASGFVRSNGDFTSVTIGGSVVGGAGQDSGQIGSGGDMGRLKIGRDLRGGSISGSDPNLAGSGFIFADHIASVFIGGSIASGLDTSTAGALTDNGAITVRDDIGAIVVQRSLLGHATANGLSPVTIVARGQETVLPTEINDAAIHSLSVGGRVEHARILAGYNGSLEAVNGNASIGPVSVGRDWIASDLVAGGQDNATAALDDPFGDADDRLGPGSTLIARIASITIGGLVQGTPAAGDHFGFVSEQIGFFKAGGTDRPPHGCSERVA